MRIELSLDISRRSLWLAGAGVIGAALVSVSTLAYAHGGDTSLVHGCYRDGQGLLRVVGADEACKPNETAVDWPKAGAIGGLETLRVESAFDSTGTKNAHALCPAGKHAVGGGYQIFGDATHVKVSESHPTPLAVGAPTGWFVFAREDPPGNPNDWSVGAIVVCASLS